MCAESNVKSLARAALRKKISTLAAQEQVSDADFADAIYAAQSGLALPEQDFRDTFGLTAGAVERWMQRKNLPQPNIRPRILGWILEKT